MLAVYMSVLLHFYMILKYEIRYILEELSVMFSVLRKSRKYLSC